jgi:hypothetical protein
MGDVLGILAGLLPGSDGDCAGPVARDKKAALAPRDEQVFAQPAEETLSPSSTCHQAHTPKIRFSRRNALWLQLPSQDQSIQTS